MPYRRLPNTDAARIKALKSAYSKGQELPPFKLAFSQNSLLKLQSFIHTLEQALLLQKQAYQLQVNNNDRYIEALKKARLYISHFIQVLNMAIIRGELPPQTRSYFGLNKDLKTLPSLKTEKEIIEFGQKIIEGESVRIREGVTCITNPTIAVVKVRYELFIDAYNFQKILQKKNRLALERLASLRVQADEIILQIWNEIEDHFKDLPEERKREEAKQYGLVYIFRKNELQKNLHFQAKQEEMR